MNDLHQFLANIWFVLLCLILVLYVVFDGFDLGVGILSLVGRTEERRNRMIATLGRAWDGNETWLIVLGVALFVAFPLVYDVALSALYIPISLMLVGLTLRAVAFEFHKRSAATPSWHLVFGAGSLLAAIAQGFAIGALVRGLDVRHGLFVGGSWSWLTPFSALVAVGLSAGYALLGATYLLMKDREQIKRDATRRAQSACWVLIIAAVAISVWMLVLHARISTTWFHAPSVYFTLALGILTVLAFGRLLWSLRHSTARTPFAWSITVFLLSFLGLAFNLFPYVIPPSITAAEAAASSRSLVFMITGIGIFIPFMLIYNGYRYLVLRGKAERTSYALEKEIARGPTRVMSTDDHKSNDSQDAVVQR